MAKRLDPSIYDTKKVFPKAKQLKGIEPSLYAVWSRKEKLWILRQKKGATDKVILRERRPEILIRRANSVKYANSQLRNVDHLNRIELEQERKVEAKAAIRRNEIAKEYAEKAVINSGIFREDRVGYTGASRY